MPAMRSSFRALTSVVGAVIAATVALAACQKEIEPPFVRGVCFHAVPLKNGQFRFNKL